MRPYISDIEAAKMFLGMDAGLIVDLDTRDILFTTQQLDMMFGYLPGELAALYKIEDLVPIDKAEAHIKHVAAFRNKPTERMMGAMGMRLSGRRKDGSIFPAEVALGKATVIASGVVVVGAKVLDMSSRGNGGYK